MRADWCSPSSPRLSVLLGDSPSVLPPHLVCQKAQSGQKSTLALSGVPENGEYTHQSHVSTSQHSRLGLLTFSCERNKDGHQRKRTWRLKEMKQSAQKSFLCARHRAVAQQPMGGKTGGKLDTLAGKSPTIHPPIHPSQRLPTHTVVFLER